MIVLICLSVSNIPSVDSVHLRMVHCYVQNFSLAERLIVYVQLSFIAREKNNYQRKGNYMVSMCITVVLRILLIYGGYHGTII